MTEPQPDRRIPLSRDVHRPHPPEFDQKHRVCDAADAQNFRDALANAYLAVLGKTGVRTNQLREALSHVPELSQTYEYLSGALDTLQATHKNNPLPAAAAVRWLRDAVRMVLHPHYITIGFTHVGTTSAPVRELQLATIHPNTWRHHRTSSGFDVWEADVTKESASDRDLWNVDNLVFCSENRAVAAGVGKYRSIVGPDGGNRRWEESMFGMIQMAEVDEQQFAREVHLAVRRAIETERVVARLLARNNSHVDATPKERARASVITQSELGSTLDTINVSDGASAPVFEAVVEAAALVRAFVSVTAPERGDGGDVVRRVLRAYYVMDMLTTLGGPLANLKPGAHRNECGSALREVNGAAFALALVQREWKIPEIRNDHFITDTAGAFHAIAKATSRANFVEF